MGRFESPRCRAVSMPECDSMDGSTARGTGNGVCDCRCEDTGNGVCASWCGCSCEDTGNRVCSSSRDRRASPLWRGVIPLRDGWMTRASTSPSVWAVAALYGSWHWKQGVSGPRSVALRSRMLLGVWSGNVGGDSV